ncbi:hypothetical protein Q3G72_031884 [Acer saccharum]|nr:hypothetical protein Q3G72_031884 [Acer saccharum]
MWSPLGIGIVAHGPLGHRFFGGKAGAVFSLQLFLQLPGIFASGFVLQSKVSMDIAKAKAFLEGILMAEEIGIFLLC